MNSHVYTITAITKDGKDCRCFGFFFDRIMAENAVELNIGGMDECRYEYILIEKQRWGIHSTTLPMQWYVWQHPKNQEGRWEECHPPKFSPCVVNWNGIG